MAVVFGNGDALVRHVPGENGEVGLQSLCGKQIFRHLLVYQLSQTMGSEALAKRATGITQKMMNQYSYLRQQSRRPRI